MHKIVPPNLVLLDQIPFSVITHMAVGKKIAKEADLGKLFSALLSNFLQSISTQSTLSDVTFCALWRVVTGIGVRSKIREIQLGT